MPTASKKVLCVEDHPDTCKLIAAILDEYKVTSAGGVVEAVEMIRSDPFDVILLDYQLPDGTGIELCHRIRLIDKQTPILFVTGSARLTLEEIEEAGAQGIVRKATHDFMDQLMRKVHAFSERRSAEGEPAST